MHKHFTNNKKKSCEAAVFSHRNLRDIFKHRDFPITFEIRFFQTHVEKIRL